MKTARPACSQCGSDHSKKLLMALDSRTIHCADCLLGNERANRAAMEGYATLLEKQHQTQLEHIRKDLATASQYSEAADKRTAAALADQNAKLSKAHEAEKEQMRRSQHERVSQLIALENSKADEKLKVALSKQQAALTNKFQAEHRLQQQTYDQRLASIKSAAVREQALSEKKEADICDHSKAQDIRIVELSKDHDVRIDELSKRVEHSDRALSDAIEKVNNLTRLNAKILTDKRTQKEELIHLLSKKEKTIDRYGTTVQGMVII